MGFIPSAGARVTWERRTASFPIEGKLLLNLSLSPAGNSTEALGNAKEKRGDCSVLSQQWLTSSSGQGIRALPCSAHPTPSI